ncbi:MAG: GntR family transcriptional regulator [Acidobacteria bacterium]|nr:GntR family transcriptional regulator [Acidobacteriota bacterium]
MPFQPVRAESLSAQVFETIRDAIFRGELKPGETLRELGLAKTLNVSQATVREALAHLEQYGLVVRTPNRSTNVTTFAADEADQRQAVRCALETVAFLEARERMTPDEMEEIAMLANEAEQSSRNGAYDAIQAERRFHGRVWELAGNPVLSRTLEQVSMPLFVRRARLRGGAGVEYKHLAANLRSGDSTAIAESLKSHLQQPPVGGEESADEVATAATMTA